MNLIETMAATAAIVAVGLGAIVTPRERPSVQSEQKPPVEVAAAAHDVQTAKSDDVSRIDKITAAVAEQQVQQRRIESKLDALIKVEGGADARRSSSRP